MDNYCKQYVQFSFVAGHKTTSHRIDRSRSRFTLPFVGVGYDVRRMFVEAIVVVAKCLRDIVRSRVALLLLEDVVRVGHALIGEEVREVRPAAPHQVLVA